MCGFTALMKKKKLFEFSKFVFIYAFSKIATLTQVSIPLTQLCLPPFWECKLQELIFFPSVSLSLGGIWVGFLRMLDQQATNSLPAGTDNRINQAETKGSCFFWEDNINKLLCTMESLTWGRIPARASLEQPGCSVPNLVWCSERMTEPQVAQFRFIVHSPWGSGTQKSVVQESKS